MFVFIIYIHFLKETHRLYKLQASQRASPLGQCWNPKEIKFVNALCKAECTSTHVAKLLLVSLIIR